jgi:hypothetical protein
MSAPRPHRTSLRYYGTLPYAVCDTGGCPWEGETRDNDIAAANDGREHERATRPDTPEVVS